MKVFASRYLESFSSEMVVDLKNWTWEPSNKEIAKIYASGAKTTTRSSTYASEKDNNEDSDRPNEGD